jgi:hypothetical protein
MIETTAYDAHVKMLENAGFTLMGIEQAKKDPDFIQSGQNRGGGFTPINGEVFEFPALEKMHFFFTEFTRDKKTYKVLKVLAQSSIRGIVEFTVAKLFYCPSLLSEREELYKDNLLGRQLADAGNDYKRLVLVSGKILEFHSRNDKDFHEDYWVTDKDTQVRTKVVDSPDLPPSKRKSLVCFKIKDLTPTA